MDFIYNIYSKHGKKIKGVIIFLTILFLIFQYGLIERKYEIKELKLSYIGEYCSSSSTKSFSTRKCTCRFQDTKGIETYKYNNKERDCLKLQGLHTLEIEMTKSIFGTNYMITKIIN